MLFRMPFPWGCKTAGLLSAGSIGRTSVSLVLYLSAAFDVIKREAFLLADILRGMDLRGFFISVVLQSGRTYNPFRRPLAIRCRR